MSAKINDNVNVNNDDDKKDDAGTGLSKRDKDQLVDAATRDGNDEPAAAATQQPPPFKKPKKEEFLKFAGRRAPRVGDEFQATLLPAPADDEHANDENTNKEEAATTTARIVQDSE